MVEFIGSSRNTIVNSQLWSNIYIHGSSSNRNNDIDSSMDPNSKNNRKLLLVNEFCEAAIALDFTILSRDSFAYDADLTFMAWYDAFKRVDNEGVLILPSSFKRTLSFYLLHMSACIRVGMIEPFLIVLNKKRKSKSQLKNKTNSI